LGFKASVLLGVLLLHRCQELGEQRPLLGMRDYLIDHVVQALTRAELDHDGTKDRPVMAETPQPLGGKGGQQQLADGGQVIGLHEIGHAAFPSIYLRSPIPASFPRCDNCG